MLAICVTWVRSGHLIISRWPATTSPGSLKKSVHDMLKQLQRPPKARQGALLPTWLRSWTRWSLKCRCQWSA
jgi:hypothetical protein